MKKYCFAIIRIVFAITMSMSAKAQRPSYPAEWKKVDSLLKKGLTRSALDMIGKVYTGAKNSGNDVQVIKSLTYRLNLENSIENDSIQKRINTLEIETQAIKQPASSILKSITASLYWNYLQQRRYQLYNRTNTTGFQKDDIETWTLDDLHAAIAAHYLASISEKSILQKTELEKFDALIIKGNVRYLRPTLYDLLAQRALDYFKNDERDISKPAYAFEIDDPAAFAPAEVFVKHSFQTRDSLSLHHKALLVYQELLAFHLTDTKADALIDADIDRIEFVYRYSVVPNKDELYLTALADLATHYPANEIAANASLTLARFIYDKAVETETENETSEKYTYKKTKAILEKIISKFPKSNAGIEAGNLLKQIVQPTLRLTTEKVNVPNLPFRTLVSYKNLDMLYLRLITMTPQLKKLIRINSDNDVLFRNLLAQTVLKSWSQPLPSMDDYQTHSVEIKIDGLNSGEYLLLSSTDKNFTISKLPLAAQSFYVSGISFINQGNEYFMLDRTTGQPLANAAVQVWEETYNYNTSDLQLTQLKKLSADKNGYLKIDLLEESERNNLRLGVTYKKDQLFLDEPQYSFYYNRAADEDSDYGNQKEYDKDNGKIFLFTDRSIYRPGQQVYFKGIGITKDWKTKQTMLIASEDSFLIFMNDANSQQVDSMFVKLNGFGSFHGSFKIPEGGLTGVFFLTTDDFENSGTSFSVEEYKRPKFLAEIDTLKKSYRVGDTVMITGTAKAYAGNSISDAHVSYTVRRLTRFLYPWMFWKTSFPRVEPQEIVHGEVMTDANGNFTFNFPAIPDLSLDKNKEPVFDYEVSVNITDLNGETRSATITVPIGYKALELKVSFPTEDPLPVDSLKRIIVTSKNLSGQPETVMSNVKIFKLQPPQRLIRPRFWAQPDTTLYSKETYISFFPHDEYRDELKKETWEKIVIAFESTDSTNSKPARPAGGFKIQNLQLGAGWYVIEATAKDRYGQDVKDVKYFQLFDPESDSLPAPGYVWSYQKNGRLEPGEVASVTTGTSAQNVFLITEVDRTKQEINSRSYEVTKENTYHFNALSKSVETFTYKIDESDRGGFGVNYFFVKDNRFFSSNNIVRVPWSNKELNISFDTYRDKTLPGSEEKWKVKISGSKGERVSAEMLASMYDASLDQFTEHEWELPAIWPTYYNSGKQWNGRQNFTVVNSFEKYLDEHYVAQKEIIYDQLISSIQIDNANFARNIFTTRAAPAMVEGRVSDMELQEVSNTALTPVVALGINRPPEANSKTESSEGDNTVSKSGIDNEPPPTQIRKNFNETAFFFPELRTDKDGNIEFTFTMPEALTRWKLMTFAHTKDLATGYAGKSVITQKDLMVQPNAPRFFREGDSIVFSAKVVNVSDKDLNGVAEFHLLNATTLNPVDTWFQNISPTASFDVKAGQSALVNFKTIIPRNFNDAVVYRIVAKAGNVSDGEEMAIPVVTNRMLVTESLPLPMRSNGTKNFTFTKLLNSGESNTLTNYGLTVEYTPNPAWYAVQALPFLMEYPYECAEQTFNRYYANSLATKIVNSSPKIKSVLEKWAKTDTSALQSNLQKNEELKSVLLEETPWVLQAKSEEQQKKNIALLFDLAKMTLQLQTNLDKLSEMQVSNGGFVWFKGGRDDRYMTQYIMTGIGHLVHLDAISETQKNNLSLIIDKAVTYLDKKIQEDYANLLKSKAKISENHLSTIAIQYLYMRSFFENKPFAGDSKTAFNYYREQSKKYWLSQRKYMQGMIALGLSRSGDKPTALDILKSLKENAIFHEELGMYWKEWGQHGYWWYQLPIESQSLMIEAFTEITKDRHAVNAMKTWLLKNKQTNNWETTKATAEACYAFLLQGTDFLSEEKTVVIKAGDATFSTASGQTQDGTAYFKRRIAGDKVKPSMGNMSVTIQPDKKTAPAENTASWGAVYWQYFEDLEKITFAETPLKLSKKLFIEKNTDRGPVLEPVSDDQVLHIGDKIKVRIELRVDREMEYIHMKDMRASCMEPVNVLSSYKFQDGLGYYESTKDVSTNFFFNNLYKGTYVFEYPMFVTHSGNFSNGITSIQCMYAPEFMAHSEGVRVKVE